MPFYCAHKLIAFQNLCIQSMNIVHAQRDIVHTTSNIRSVIVSYYLMLWLLLFSAFLLVRQDPHRRSRIATVCSSSVRSGLPSVVRISVQRQFEWIFPHCYDSSTHTFIGKFFFAFCSPSLSFSFPRSVAPSQAPRTRVESIYIWNSMLCDFQTFSHDSSMSFTICDTPWLYTYIHIDGLSLVLHPSAFHFMFRQSIWIWSDSIWTAQVWPLTNNFAWARSQLCWAPEDSQKQSEPQQNWSANGYGLGSFGAHG